MENNSYRRIYNSLEKYINIIKDHFDENAKTSSFKADEHDIYVAYGFLWGIKFLIEDTKLESISRFNYSDYKNFTIFLNKYGNSGNISKNYNKNFNNELIKNKIIDININIAFVNIWLIKLEERKLNPIPKKTKKNKEKVESKNEEGSDKNEPQENLLLIESSKISDKEETEESLKEEKKEGVNNSENQNIISFNEESSNSNNYSGKEEEKKMKY